MITNAVVAGIKADLDNITFNNNLLVILMGNTVIGDTNVRFYGFDSSSSATADGNLVIRPSLYASTNGRLIRRSWDQNYNTSQITENTNLYFTQARALSTPLTGYAAGTSTPITATNTILNGMQNLQAQITAINNNMAVNGATVGLNKVQLNTAYPNVGFGYMVFCPSIILGGAIYVKNNSLTGTSGTWQTISAPPTL